MKSLNGVNDRNTRSSPQNVADEVHASALMPHASSTPPTFSRVPVGFLVKVPLLLPRMSRAGAGDLYPEAGLDTPPAGAASASGAQQPLATACVLPPILR